MKVIKSKFKPAWWLKNCHCQTFWGTLFRRPPKLKLIRERINLFDDDFIDVDWTPSTLPTEAPIVLILHGLGGSIHSHYAGSMMETVYHAGWRGIFMHFRGCSEDPNKSHTTYHGGYIDDVAYLTELLKRRYPNAPIIAIGYSLGGNILLNYICQHTPIEYALAVSVPFDLKHSVNKVMCGIGRFYQWYALQALKYRILTKYNNLECPLDIDAIRQAKNFWEFDNFYTAKAHGFSNATEYYRKASCKYNLPKIKTPAHIIQALDDPLMTEEVIPNNLNKNTTLELSEHGGHVGFISGSMPFNPVYWLDKRIKHLIETHIKKGNS